MNNPYNFHFWNTQYREETLQEARERHLVERARVGREPRGLRRVGLAWTNALAALLREARAAEQ